MNISHPSPCVAIFDYHDSTSLTWRFSGGRKVKVNVVEGIQEHVETTDNL